MRACEGCGTSIEGRRADARTCSATCRERVKKQKQRGTVVDLRGRGVDGDEPLLVAEVIRELTGAGRLETADGQTALFLARRFAATTADTGSAVAALSRELRAARAEALKGAQVQRTSLDELRTRRDAKRGA